MPDATAAAAAESADAMSRAGAAALALALQAVLLDGARLAAVAQDAVRLLAGRLGFDAVWLALAEPSTALRLVAVSDGSPVERASAMRERALAALGEVFDQRAAVCWPPPQPADAAAPPRIVVAQRALVPAGGAAAGWPLVAGGRVVGALCVARVDGPALCASELQTMGHLLGLAAPVLALKADAERPWRQRLVAAWRAWVDTQDSAGLPRWWRWRWALAGLAALALLAWPIERVVGGQARLEGAVQRVLSAPEDGFVQQVHARPGDTVRAGQPLLELADQDLLLERSRLSSQLAQHLDAYAAAQSRADRAQLAQQQGQAAEAEAQLALVDEKLGRARLTAPFDGIVVSGDWSRQLGAPVKQGGELMTLAPLDDFRVIVEVDERDIALLAPGQRGSLALSALPWDTLALRVLRIAPVAQAVVGRNVFEVEARLLQRVPGLRPGLQGSARVFAGRGAWGWRGLRHALAALRRALWEWLG